MSLKNQIALVTGGGRAIGRSIALRLAQEGADVFLAALPEAGLKETADGIRDLGRRAETRVTDVREEDQVRAAVKQARESLGPIDILVNNAGVMGPTAPVGEVRLEDWNEVLAVNLTGAFLVSKAVGPEMMRRRSGRIINISSIAGKIGYPLRSPYAASKWGLIGLTLTMARELGPYDVQVNALCPGPVTGERMRRVIEGKAESTGQTVEEVTREYHGAAVLGRMVTEEEVASTIAFLAGEAGAAITGQAIEVSAGYGL